jgi:DNA-binding transcriptional LysR family regulator
MPGMVPVSPAVPPHRLPVLMDGPSVYLGVDLGWSLRDVSCFVVVADRLSFSRAAATLGMSQPAVSQAIARLERVLGLRLFERTSREVQLSHAGKLLLPYAEALLDNASGLAAEAAWLAVPAGGAIRLAYCPLVGTLAARVARRLASRAPAIEVALQAAGWSAATAELVQGSASAALMSSPFPAGFATTARFQVPVEHVAVPAGSRLATAARLAPAQLPRVLLPRNRPPGSLWAQLSNRLRAGSRLPVDDLDDLPAALDLVAAGRGLVPAPRLLVETVRRPDIRFIRLDAPGLRMTYALVWRPHESVSAELMALVQATQEVMRG